MLLWKTKNKTKQTNKSTAIFHGLYSYRPQKWRQNVQNFAVKPLADISYERATWAFFLVLLACVLGDKAGLCVGNLFWGKKTIKHVSEDTFSDQSSNGKGRKTAIASPKVSWELKVIHAPINVKPAGGGGGEGIWPILFSRGREYWIFLRLTWDRRGDIWLPTMTKETETEHPRFTHATYGLERSGNYRSQREQAKGEWISLHWSI